MRKRDLAKRTATDELQSAAAEWGQAATQMLLTMSERLDALEKRIDALETEHATPDALTRRGTE